MPYWNITGLTGATDFITMMNYFQFTIGIPFAELVMLMVFFVSFFALKRYDTMRALPPSVFITLFSALMFWLMGLLNVVWVYALSVSFAVSVIMIYFYQEQ